MLFELLFQGFKISLRTSNARHDHNLLFFVTCLLVHHKIKLIIDDTSTNNQCTGNGKLCDYQYLTQLSVFKGIDNTSLQDLDGLIRGQEKSGITAGGQTRK